MAESIECYPVGARITCAAAEDITGQTFVAITAARTDGNYTIRTATARGAVFGVAHRDRRSALKVGVNRKIVCTVIAGGTVNPGNQVQVGSGGRAVAFSDGIAVGYACTGGASGEAIEVALY